ncbi:MAG: FAD-binding oxidoreductase [Steroidobacteraceae bacterium]|jgi:FAD/FMN-containing dehydrogenase
MSASDAPICAGNAEDPRSAARVEPDSAVDLLIRELGSDVVTVGAEVDPRYFTAYNEPPGIRPRSLVRANSVAQIARVLEICNRLGQPIVPQGGLTGLARGAVPVQAEHREIVVALERYAGVEEIDTDAATVTVRAGTVLQSLQQQVDEAGFSLGIDLGARGSCQIGGNIATNAGGNRAIRFGMMRDQVLGLEVVLANGTVVSSLNKMLKNNAGYDLKHLFIGSEGTLGIITRAVLKLHPRLETPATALCAVADYGAVVRLWRRAREELSTIVSFEVMWPGFYDYVTHHTPDVAPPLAVADCFYVLLECAAPGRGMDAIPIGSLEDRLCVWLEQGLIVDAALAASVRQAQAMWTIREGLAIDALPNLVNFDVSLAIGSIDQFAVRCARALKARWPQSLNLFFGHIGDSNVHIGVSIADLAQDEVHLVDEVVYGVVREMGGSISAEHGIGRLKRPFLGHTRSAPEIELMRIVKQALDPRGILNPGKVL